MNRFALSFVMVAFSAATGAGPSLADTTTGLLHYWKFDETEGNFASDSVGGNAAVLGGYAIGDPTWSIGKVGGALRFSKVTNYALTTAPISADQYTISFWSQLKVRSGVNPRLVTPQESGWVGANFESNKGIGAFPAYNLVEPVPNAWEQYTVTIDITNHAAATYMNGVLVRSATTNLPPAIGNWIFGHNGDTSNHADTWNGLIDDVRIYDRILSSSDVAELFPITGDFNFNGAVGTDDYDLWQDAFGSTSIGDADFDNDSDGKDLLLWQRHFGESKTGVIAVPEPTGTVALLVGLTVAGTMRRAVMRCAR